MPIVSSAPSLFTSHSRTRAPSPASISAVARPMPEAPPVSITVLYLSCISPPHCVARMNARESGRKSGIPHSASLHAGYKLSPCPCQKIRDAPLRLLRREQAPGPLGLGRKAVALGIARKAHAHLAGGERKRMQARDAPRDRKRLRGKIGARHRPLHHAEFPRGFSIDRLGGEDDAGGDRRSGDPGEALRSPGARQQPKARLG